MPRTAHRPRKSVSVARARLLTLMGFRYSTTRDAYVLRGIGNHFGPVYQVETRPHLTAESESSRSDELSHR